MLSSYSFSQTPRTPPQNECQPLMSGGFEHSVDYELIRGQEKKKFFCYLCSKTLADCGLDH